MRSSWRPAAGLFLIAPIVAEFLHGNLPATLLWLLLFLAPLYGGAAVVIREVSRRRRGGWPMIITLSTAFALVEEGLTTQSLFNPDYADANLLEPAAIPVLGIGGWWTIFVVVLHVVSLGVSIALIEALVPERAAVAWLGGRGLGIAIGLFVVGAVLTTAITLAEDPYVAAPAQLLGVAVAVILLVDGRAAPQLAPEPPKSVSSLLDRTRPTPGSGKVGVIGGALIATYLASIIALEAAHWAALALEVVAVAVLAIALRRWSRRCGWSLRHVLAAATGAATAYACFGLLTPPVVDSDPVADLVCNALVAGAVLWLCLVGPAALRRPC